MLLFDHLAHTKYILPEGPYGEQYTEHQKASSKRGGRGLDLRGKITEKNGDYKQSSFPLVLPRNRLLSQRSSKV